MSSQSGGIVVGQTQPGRFFNGVITGKTTDVNFSPDENTRVMINCSYNPRIPTQGIGSTTAHEFVHVQLLWLHAAGKVDKWRHSVPEDPVMKNLMKQTEMEAIK